MIQLALVGKHTCPRISASPYQCATRKLGLSLVRPDRVSSIEARSKLTANLSRLDSHYHAEHTKQCAVLGMLLFLMCLPVHAAVDWGPVNPDELKMTSETLAPGAQAVILYRQVDRDDSTYPFFEQDYVRIKISDEEGRKFADVEFLFTRKKMKTW